MSDHVYKKLELVGSSTVSSDDAARNAIAQAQATIRNMDWFEVVDTRGHIVDAKVAHWHVRVKIRSRLEN